MISQRDIFWSEIYDLAKNDRDIIVVSADMGAPSLDRFRRDFPDQFVNTGIAEQNAILIAAGLAMEGKNVFVYAIASFLTLNCIEKIRVQCSMMKIKLNLVGVGAGFSYADSGPTHHLIEDVSIMRALPGIDVYDVTNSEMAQMLAKSYKNIKNTRYIRLERANYSLEIESKDIDLDKGMHLVKKGRDTLFIASSYICYKLESKLRDSSVGLLNLFKYPINEEELSKTLKDYKNVVTVEEHFLDGGLGSAILEVINNKTLDHKVKRYGLKRNDGYCYKYGGRDNIHKYYGLNINQIVNDHT